MEPLTTGAIAVGILILKKAFEKTGDTANLNLVS